MGTSFKKVLLLGDSLTFGVGSGAAGIAIVGGYRLPLYQLLVSSGINPMFVGPNYYNSPYPIVYGGDANTYHAGYPGYRIDQLAVTVGSQWSFYLFGLAATLSQPGEVNAIVLMAGTNDILQGGSPSDVLLKLKNMVSYLKVWYPTAKIVVCTVPPLFLSPYVNQTIINNITSYNNLIQSDGTLMSDLRVRIAEVFKPLLSGAEYSNGDGIHPSSVAGYNIMANSIAQTLIPALR